MIRRIGELMGKVFSKVSTSSVGKKKGIVRGQIEEADLGLLCLLRVRRC